LYLLSYLVTFLLTEITLYAACMLGDCVEFVWFMSFSFGNGLHFSDTVFLFFSTADELKLLHNILFRSESSIQRLGLKPITSNYTCTHGRCMTS